MKKKQIVLYPKMLTEIFASEGIPYRTGMSRRHEYACIAIAIGKPKKNKN